MLLLFKLRKKEKAEQQMTLVPNVGVVLFGFFVGFFFLNTPYTNASKLLKQGYYKAGS